MTRSESKMASLKHYMKLYSMGLGIVCSFLAFLWLSVILYVLSETDPNSNDLLMARYLDISFGLLAFTSSLTLIYGSFVESKTWISVWTFGSVTCLIGYWSFFFYKKYAEQSPESKEDAQTTMLTITGCYVILLLPVLKYYNHLKTSPGLLKKCSRGQDDNDFSVMSSKKIGRSYLTKEGFLVSIPIEEDLYYPV